MSIKYGPDADDPNIKWVEGSSLLDSDIKMGVYDVKFVPKTRTNKGWECHLFGSNGIDGLVYRPSDYKPNLLVRLMCKWLLDCKWVECK